MSVFVPIHPSIYTSGFDSESAFVNAYNAEIMRLAGEDSSRHVVENGQKIYGKLANGNNLYMRVHMIYDVKFKGCVVRLSERNYYDDSDFFAIVWNPKTENMFTYNYTSTRYGGGSYATVDITMENSKRAEEVHYQRLFESFILDKQQEHENPRFVFGGKAEVTQKHSPRGREAVHTGTIVEVEKQSEGKFGTVFLVRLIDGSKVFIPKNKIKFLPLDALDWDADEVTEEAHRHAMSHKSQISNMYTSAKNYWSKE